METRVAAVETIPEIPKKFNYIQIAIENHLQKIWKVNWCGKWVLHRSSYTNRATRGANINILLYSAKNIECFYAIKTPNKKLIFFKNTTNCTPVNNQNHKTIYPRKEAYALCFWNSKCRVSGQMVTMEFYVQFYGINKALHNQGVNTSSTKFLQNISQPILYLLNYFTVFILETLR